MIDLDTLRAALSSPDERTRALAARSVCPCQAGFDLFLELEPELHFLAVVRAGFDRPATPDGLADIDRRVADELMADGVMPSGRLNDYLRARTRFIDQQVATALAGNVRQIVIVGAGYDFRAWRFRDRGVRFFEIDHPATQADKRRLLRARWRRRARRNVPSGRSRRK